MTVAVNWSPVGLIYNYGIFKIDPTSMIRKKEKGCFSRMIDENRKNRKEIRKRIKLYYQRGIKAQNIKSSAKIENHQMKI